MAEQFYINGGEQWRAVMRWGSEWVVVVQNCRRGRSRKSEKPGDEPDESQANNKELHGLNFFTARPAALAAYLPTILVI